LATCGRLLIGQLSPLACSIPNWRLFVSDLPLYRAGPRPIQILQLSRAYELWGRLATCGRLLIGQLSPAACRTPGWRLIVRDLPLYRAGPRPITNSPTVPPAYELWSRLATWLATCGRLLIGQPSPAACSIPGWRLFIGDLPLPGRPAADTNSPTVPPTWKFGGNQPPLRPPDCPTSAKRLHLHLAHPVRCFRCVVLGLINADRRPRKPRPRQDRSVAAVSDVRYDFDLSLPSSPR
jgi:hypothetical protein